MKTASQITLEAFNLTLEQKAKIIAQYNGQKGTMKQVEKVLKVYSTHEYLDRFIVQRWNAIVESKLV